MDGKAKSGGAAVRVTHTAAQQGEDTDHSE